MHRFQISPALAKGELVVLPEDESRHAATVLRLEPGDRVELLDGAGGRMEATVETVGRREVVVRVGRRHPVVARRPEVWLLAALLKGKAWDATVQKATELGAAVIAPMQCERCVVRVDPAEGDAKVESWRRTAIEAAKQCGTPWLPRVLRPAPVAAVLSALGKPDAAFVAALSGETRPIRGWAPDIRSGLGREPATIAVAIGPEGDFVPAELEALGAAGFRAITLGPLVLRADTAAIASLAVVQHEFGAS